VVVYWSPRLRDDSKKDQRDQSLRRDVLARGVGIYFIPYETAPMYGATTSVRLLGS
jgi:hypothetical protein